MHGGEVAEVAGIAGLSLYKGIISCDQQTRLCALVEEWLVAGRAGRLHRCSYESRPDDWQATGQGREDHHEQC